MSEVAEFVQDDVVSKMLREEMESDVQVNVPFGRTGTPIGLIVLEGDFLV